ncbi:hypothetical protein LXL04_033526 [Taraxacum kok-saghyz]
MFLSDDHQLQAIPETYKECYVEQASEVLSFTVPISILKQPLPSMPKKTTLQQPTLENEISNRFYPASTPEPEPASARTSGPVLGSPLSTISVPVPQSFYLPPPSTPRATGHSPAHTTAADPLDDPPDIRFGSYGFRDVLWDMDSFSISHLCKRHKYPPVPVMRVYATGSCTKLVHTTLPLMKLPVVGYGVQSISSLTAMGTPSRTEIASPISAKDFWREFEAKNECGGDMWHICKDDSLVNLADNPLMIEFSHTRSHTLTHTEKQYVMTDMKKAIDHGHKEKKLNKSEAQHFPILEYRVLQVLDIEYGANWVQDSTQKIDHVGDHECNISSQTCDSQDVVYVDNDNDLLDRHHLSFH